MSAGDLVEAERLLAAIADYNEYDCVCTLGLRDWLLARADENHVAIDTESRVLAELAIAAAAPALLAETPLHAALLESVPVDALQRTPDQQAMALAAAAIEYHRREEKAFWWEHFARQLDEPSGLGGAAGRPDRRPGYIGRDRGVVQGAWPSGAPPAPASRCARGRQQARSPATARS